jgi:hypothetical protein
MTHIVNRIKISFLLAFSTMMIFSSCNKDLEQFAEEPVTPPSGLALGETLAASANDSLFYNIVKKGGMTATLNNKANSYTLFAPDNAAVIASFGGSLASANATIAGLSPLSCASIVSYNLIGQKFTSAAFTTTFPNVQLPTSIVLDATNPLIRMTTFLSKNNGTNYVNNIPVGAVDIQTANGIIHKPLAIVAPPQGVLKTIIAATPNTKYFRAAIARGDSGQVGTNRFDSLLNYGVTNMTVLVPNDAAFQTLLIGSIANYLISVGTPPATALAQATAIVNAVDASGNPTVFKNPLLYGVLTATTVRGILAYHFLAAIPPGQVGYQPIYRAFSVNFSTTPTFVQTLVKNAVPLHPGILVTPTFTGPFVTNLAFSSYGSFPPGGAPFSYTATAIGPDKHAVNGVFHVLDKVLLPQ